LPISDHHCGFRLRFRHEKTTNYRARLSVATALSATCAQVEATGPNPASPTTEAPRLGICWVFSLLTRWGSTYRCAWCSTSNIWPLLQAFSGETARLLSIADFSLNHS